MPKQRVVVKDPSFNDLPQKLKMWKNRKWFWSRDRNNDLIPTEIKTMFDLRGRIDQEYIAKILSWRMSRHRRWHRIHMAFCPLRNLVSVVEQAKDANEVSGALYIVLHRGTGDGRGGHATGRSGG